MPASNSFRGEPDAAAPSGSYLGLLRQSLSAIAEECSGHYAGICQVLAGTVLKLRIGTESGVLLCRLDSLTLLSEAALETQLGFETLNLRVAAGACTQLLGGHLRLLDALREEQVWVQSPPQDLQSLNHALRLFLFAALNSQRCRLLLEELRRLDSGEAREGAGGAKTTPSNVESVDSVQLDG